MTERQRLQYLSSFFPFQSGIPGSNKTRRLRRKRIQFMESWLRAAGFWVPTIRRKTLIVKDATELLTADNIQQCFQSLRNCYDESRSTRVKLEPDTNPF